MKPEKPFRALITTFEDPDLIDDASEVYGDQERFDDQVSDCCARHGGIVILSNGSGAACAHCGKPLGQ